MGTIAREIIAVVMVISVVNSPTIGIELTPIL